MSKKLIIIGVGGHGKVILDIAHKCGYEVIGFLDDYATKMDIEGYSILGTSMAAYDYEDAEFIVAIGVNETRKKVVSSLKGIRYATLVHPAAVIGEDVSIGEGSVVMANAVVNPGARIGVHCIINTSSVIEHDNTLEDFVHISPGAVLAGTVKIGKCTHVGAGAVIRNNLVIKENCTIGMGAVVVKNIDISGVYIGNPAKAR